MFMLSFFVPSTHVEMVKNALFKAGAGRLGDYDCCAWQTLGEGQFRPLEGSKPFLGNVDKGIERVPEYRVEMLCEDAKVASAISVLKQAHPYEEAAYAVWAVNDLP